MTLTAHGARLTDFEVPGDWTVTFVDDATPDTAALLLPTHLWWRVERVPDPPAMSVGAVQALALLPTPLKLHARVYPTPGFRRTRTTRGE